VAPVLNDVGIAFGLLQIGWFVWLGIVMLRADDRREQVLVPGVEPA